MIRLVTFSESGRTRIGAWDVASAEIIDLCAVDSEIPQNMLAYIAMGNRALDRTIQSIHSDRGRLALSSVRLLAPIPLPARNIFCVGKNYPDHVKEIQSVVASPNDTLGGVTNAPIIFTKLPSTVIGPDDPIPAHLDFTQSVDYEGELAVVIGTAGRGIPQAQAMQHVFGYTIVNDVTSRRLQKQHQQWFVGKSLDGFCPMGPCLLLHDPDISPGSFHIQTVVNDELRQDGTVGDLIFDIPTLIATLSRTMTLQPGDIIATGTPAGVGMGFNPPRYLIAGDRVSITIEPIGTLTNPVE